LWKSLNIENDIFLEINNLGTTESRNLYSASLVEFLKQQKGDFDQDTQRKLKDNPLRILDSKSTEIQEILKDAPLLVDFIDDDSKQYHESLLNILEKVGVDYVENNKLVRGLDYYNQTVFEWKTKLLGSQDTVAGGGRYDGLVAELGGKDCPAVGFSIGLERLLLLLKHQDQLSLESALDIYFICQSERATQEAIMLRENLKSDYPALRIKINLGLESLSSQFKKADKSGASIAIIIGEEELEKKMFSLKNLRSKSDQEMLNIEELSDKLQNFYK